jgi:hypothetical protein|tara:strand:- start:30 stop:275 length:246 start_codon:yes stop_codon:yes gene_type:complete
MAKNYKAYVCRTDWTYHFPDDWDGVNIYFSKESIMAHRGCIKECGVTEVRVMSEGDYIHLMLEFDDMKNELEEIKEALRER